MTANPLVKEPLVSEYERGIQDAWEAINKLITYGDLGGNGCDKNAERNGLVLAANEICAMPGFKWPEPSLVSVGGKR